MVMAGFTSGMRIAACVFRGRRLVVMLAFIVAAPLADLLSGRRPHPISLWGGLLLVASMPLRFAVAQTAAWHQFARWLITQAN